MRRILGRPASPRDAGLPQPAFPATAPNMKPDTMLPSRSTFHRIRGLDLHVRTWDPRGGGPDTGAPVLVMLHGWMDVSASFQFLVDALQGGWRVLAPDWRGFGLSGRDPEGAYAYPDYLADLDALLEVIHPGAPARLVGHSLGGNIACIYASARPERVRCVVNIDASGLRARKADEAPQLLRQWLEETRKPLSSRPYAGMEEVTRRIRELSRRITPDRAAFVASHWGVALPAGGAVLRADPAHRRPSPVMYRIDEARAYWRAVQAPVLWLDARQTENLKRHGISKADLARRRACVPNLTHGYIEDAGHMAHWEQPEQLAALMAPFLDAQDRD